MRAVPSAPVLPPPRIDHAAAEELREAVRRARAALAAVADERAARDAQLAGWQGGHRLARDARERELAGHAAALDAALRDLVVRLDDEVDRLARVRAARTARREALADRQRGGGSLPCLVRPAGP